MNKKTNIEESLLIQFFCENLTVEEEFSVKEWIEQSAENRELAEQVYYALHSIETLNAVEKIDTDKAWETVEKQIKPQKSAKSFLLAFQRIAAILIFPLLFTSIFLLLKNHHSSPTSSYITVKANDGMITSFTLPDKTNVWLNSGTTLRYPSDFNDIREVTLDGEAFFDVTKDSKRKFVVSLRDSLAIEVLGTKFNVEAYRNKTQIATTLVEGNIQFIHYKNNHKKVAPIVPSQKITYNHLDQSICIKNVSVSPDTAWIAGKIIFEDSLLEDVLDILSKHYNTTFIIKNPPLKKERFTGHFAGKRLDDILEYFFISSQIKYRYISRANENEQENIIEIY